MNKIMRFIKDEDGLELTEYAIIGALIAVATATAIGLLGDTIEAKFTEMESTIDPAS
jgi:pilus assembly protein Flp/PilA